MPESVATLTSDHASKYLQQVCKHFAHKIEVSYDESHGECVFEMGKGTLDADGSTLTITASASNQSDLERTQSVIESHLIRFAFREELSPLTWTAKAG